jgi:hypothetical protein
MLVDASHHTVHSVESCMYKPWMKGEWFCGGWDGMRHKEQRHYTGQNPTKAIL